MTTLEVAKPHIKDGRYVLRLPGSPKTQQFTRCTTFIEALDQKDGLIDWTATAAIVGMHRDAGKAAQWAALCAEFTDPWYSGDDAKDRCKKLVKECKDKGGATTRADYGDALHDMIRVLNRGGTLGPLSDAYRPDIEAYRLLLDEWGIVPDPSLCEVSLFNPVYNVVGTVDFFASARGHDQLVTCDVKTGGTGHVHPKYGSVDGIGLHELSFAAQLGNYQQATHRIIWPANRDDECELVELPPRDPDVGYIVHVPAGQGAAYLWRIDLDTGRTALELAKNLRQIRNKAKRKDVVVSRMTTSATSPQPHPDVAAPTSWLRAEQLRARIAKLSPAQQAELKAAWPKGISLKREVTREESAIVADLVARFESSMERVTDSPDEGRDADRATIKVLEQRFAALDDVDKAWIMDLNHDAEVAGGGLRLTDRPTLRRFEITRALVFLARHGQTERLPDLIASSLGDVPGSPGALLASMGVDDAMRFAQLVDALAVRPADEEGEPPTLTLLPAS